MTDVPITEYHKPGTYPYTLGRGIVRIRKYGETTWQDLFHVKEFKVSVATEELTHENYRNDLKRTDKAVVTSMKASGSFMVDIPAIDNVMAFLCGSAVTSSAQTDGTWTAESFTVVAPGRWQDLGKRMITMSAITDDTGTPVALVEGTDYYADWENGLFLPLPGSTMVGTIGDVFKVTGTYAAHTKHVVQAGETAELTREIYFAGDPAKGVRFNVFAYANLKPSGDINFIGDDWQSFSFEFTCQEHPTYGEVGLQVEKHAEVV